MPKEAMIRARVETHLKAEVEDIFQELGLSITEAITLFYRQVKLNQGLPFEVRLPNATTVKTFQDTDAGRNVVKTKDAKELFKKLGL
jgi:DNA-damage-inducible protein J